ncbi:unnamed protein product (macronuclear) [Paramecium tetraurelia]|uniref:Uncharacterized protein n=1 Tax=Paramecium tetraurelia TaxID=5888 RepID=A0EA45_PARTE|nr:uncharacterized protein GSPATT00024894001 [Paramecium tetraurelia]CAK92162.1 unnamed protein product [Paramecium tetraurelia]|eukprot:XP_001459559.1 hypothetical protein (macronuclear) [Paramecium tetraurelia strain d4-2]
MRTARIAQSKQQGNTNKLTSIKNTLKFQFDDENDKNVDRTTSPSITIKDLCQEEKAKIGDLIRRLAQEQEENKKLQDQIRQKEEECKKQVTKYKQLSESAKKEQKQTEDKFKESLEVIKKLQQQEQLIQEQMLLARVNKFDSFTQCEIDNKENNSKVSQASITPPIPPQKQQKSEILQLKAEIEEFTNSLKQFQFESNRQERQEISPIRKVIKPETKYERQVVIPRHQTPVNPPKPDQRKHIEVQTMDSGNRVNPHQNSADKQIQTETESFALNSHASNFFKKENEQPQETIKTLGTQKSNQTMRFCDEFKILENKLKQNQNQYYNCNKDLSESSESPQKNQYVPDESSDDEDEYAIAQELLKRKNQRISQQCQKRSSIGSQRGQQVSDVSLQKQQQFQQNHGYQQQQYAQYPYYQQFQQQTQSAQQQNLISSNYFKTNTLSFNLTNQEYTPQQSVQKSAEQFGSSVMQTPQQRDMISQQLQFSQQEEDIDSVITSLNGRSFNKPNVLQQEQYPMIEQQQESYSSESSLPREEYQKLIDKYMKDNQDSDDD